MARSSSATSTRSATPPSWPGHAESRGWQEGESLVRALSRRSGQLAHRGEQRGDVVVGRVAHDAGTHEPPGRAGRGRRRARRRSCRRATPRCGAREEPVNLLRVDARHGEDDRGRPVGRTDGPWTVTPGTSCSPSWSSGEQPRSRAAITSTPAVLDHERRPRRRCRRGPRSAWSRSPSAAGRRSRPGARGRARPAEQVGLQHEDARRAGRTTCTARSTSESTPQPSTSVGRCGTRATRVDEDPGAVLVGDRHGAREVGRVAGEVRGAREGHPAGRPSAQGRFERLDVERAVDRVDREHHHRRRRRRARPPASRASTFESWSSWVHTMRSPGSQCGASARVKANIEVGRARRRRRPRPPRRRRAGRPPRAPGRPPPRSPGSRRTRRRGWPAPASACSRRSRRSRCRPAGCRPVRRGGPSRRRGRGSGSGDRAASPPQHAPVRSGPGKSPADGGQGQQPGRRRLGGAEAHIAQRRHADGPQGAPATGGPSGHRPEQRQAGEQGAVVAVGPEPGRGRRRQRAADDRRLRAGRPRAAGRAARATP